MVGLVALTSASGEEALARVLRYNRLVSTAGRWSLLREDDRAGVVMRWERAGERSLGHRGANETVLAEFVAAARAVMDDVT